MINPPIEELLARVDSKFTLVTLASRRARQVNSYFHSLGANPGSIVPPQVTSTARKPLSIGFEEIAADKITYRRVDEAELAAALADEEGEPSDGEAKAVLGAVADEGAAGEGGDAPQG
jgi:DNA-directed RNA polymerase subunit omega